MMEKILLNILLFLGVVWMLLGIVYFCFQCFPFRKKGGKKKEGGATVPLPEKEPKKEDDSHILVGRSKAFISSSSPRVPAVSSSEKEFDCSSGDPEDIGKELAMLVKKFQKFTEKKGFKIQL